MKSSGRWLTLGIAFLFALSGTTGIVTAQNGGNSFNLPVVAANCKRMPTGFSFQGGDCVPANHVSITVTTTTGELLASCIPSPDTAEIVAGCSIPVPFGMAVIVTEDLNTVPPGYTPTINPQPFDVPVSPPQGEFGGPVFINLPDVSDTTAVRQPTTSTALQVPPSVCSGPPPPTPTLDASLNLPGYVALFSDGTMFVAWTEAGGALSGTLYLTTADDKSPDGFRSENVGFTGLRSGNRVTLTIPQGFGFASTIAGVVDGDTLTLYFSNDSGRSTAATFHRGTLAEYDQAGRSLRQEASQVIACAQELGATATAIAAQLEATATAIAAQQNAVYNANTTLDYAIRRLADDVVGLAAKSSFEEVLSAYARDWDTMQNGDKAMRADAMVQPFDCSQLDTVKYDLNMIDYDRSQISYDDSSLTYVVDSVNADIATIQNDMEAVQSGYRRLQGAVAANTTGGPPPQFTQSDVDTKVTKAQQQIDESALTMQKAQAQKNYYNQKAADLLTQAQDFVAGLTCSG